MISASTNLLTSDCVSRSSSDSNAPIPNTSRPSKAISLSLVFVFWIILVVDYFRDDRHSNLLWRSCADRQPNRCVHSLQSGFLNALAREPLEHGKLAFATADHSNIVS